MKRQRRAQDRVWAPLGGRSLLEDVREFVSRSLKGYYRDDFEVNSKNWMEMSAGTRLWIEVCNDLLERGAAEVQRSGPSKELGGALKSIFELLDRIDDGDDRVVFFADEAGTWQVGVDWDQVLPAWFRCLALAATPEVYEAEVEEVLERYRPGHRLQLLAQARRLGSRAG